MLSLNNFGVAFGERIILESVTLDIPSPGCTVLLGPSGTGKSTLMRTLAGSNDASPLLRTWGEVHHEDRCKPALVMQNSQLLISSVLENLVCNLPDRGELTRLMQIERIRPLLEQTGYGALLERLNQKAVECSLGEQRAIAILRAALSGTSLLMIDEPTARLPEAAAGQILALVECLSNRFGILLVLHNLLEARRVANQIALLADGRIHESGPAGDFFSAPRTESGRIFLATGSCPEVSRSQPEAEAPPVTSFPHTQESVSAPSEPPVKHPSAPPSNTNPHAHASQSMGPRGFLWVIPGQLAGTPWPGIVQEAEYDLAALRQVGVTDLLTLTEYPYDQALAARYGIACRHSPMPDMQPPTESQAIALCQHIDQLLASGRVIAVHCRAGLGRTGTLLTAYRLWQADGCLSALKALEDIRRIEPMWVQSQPQVEFLEQFAAMLAQARASCQTKTSARTVIKK